MRGLWLFRRQLLRGFEMHSGSMDDYTHQVFVFRGDRASRGRTHIEAALTLMRPTALNHKRTPINDDFNACPL